MPHSIRPNSRALSLAASHALIMSSTSVVGARSFRTNRGRIYRLGVHRAEIVLGLCNDDFAPLRKDVKLPTPIGHEGTHRSFPLVVWRLRQSLSVEPRAGTGLIPRVVIRLPARNKRPNGFALGQRTI